MGGRSRRRSPTLAPLPGRQRPHPGRRPTSSPTPVWDVVAVLRAVVLAVCVLVTALYVVGLTAPEVSGVVALAALLLSGLVETTLVVGSGMPADERPPVPRHRFVRPRSLAWALVAVAVLAGIATVAREPADDDLVGSALLVVPLLVVLVASGSWLLGVLLAMVVVLPLGWIATGLAMLARGDADGWPCVLVGVWIFSIAAYPTCLGLAGDGPRRSLGLAPLLGVETSSWVLHHPGWLWPARFFAVLVWGPVLVAPAYAVVAHVRRRPSP